MLTNVCCWTRPRQPHCRLTLSTSPHHPLWLYHHQVYIADADDALEQESLLTSLSSSAQKHDTTYRLLFTALPLLSTLPFIYNILVSPSRSTTLPALLSVTSLGITAWTMYSTHTDAGLGDPAKRPSAIFNQRPSGSSSQRSPTADQSPLAYLPYLNYTLAALLLLLSFVYASKGDASDSFWLLLFLPAVMLGVVSVVGGSMREIDRGLGELRGLRYEYKGA